MRVKSETNRTNGTSGNENITHLPVCSSSTSAERTQNEVKSTATEEKPLINLLRGWPNPALLPVDQLKKAANKVLSDPDVYVPGLEYAPDSGFEPLRASLAEWTSKHYNTGRKAATSEICITGGASQSLACLLASFTDVCVTRCVWMAAPCYYLACPIFEDAGFGRSRMRAVPEDEEGLDVDKLRELFLLEEEKKSGFLEQKTTKSPLPDRKHYRHLIYLVPTCSNPSGKTMGLKRRQDLVNLAREFDALVICDDVYDFLQWSVLDTTSSPLLSSSGSVPLIKSILPRLSDIDILLGPSPHDPPGKTFGHAVSNGSFSKLAAPGVRTGWVHASPDFALGLSKTGATRSGGAPSQLAATFMNELIVNGELEKHLTETVRPGLQRRHALLVSTIKKELVEPLGCVIIEQQNKRQDNTGGERGKEEGEKVFGGYFIWVQLPLGIKGKEVSLKAKEQENLVVAEGELFEVMGDEDAARFGSYLRLSFSWEEEDKIVEGVKRLGKVLEGMMMSAEKGYGNGERVLLEKRTEIVGLDEEEKLVEGGSGEQQRKGGKGICYGQVMYY